MSEPGDLADLLVQIRRSYGRGAGQEHVPSEGVLLDELAEVDVLVLDDLGRERVTDWSFDQFGVMLGARYNAGKLTIATTNLPNLPPGAGQRGTETLGDRIGARMFSRLQEMCRPVELLGHDFRTRRQG
jgi:DNA replication protein DnaC